MPDEVGVTVETDSPSANVVLPDDRPVQNVLAEFNRKMGKVDQLEQKLTVLTDYLTQKETAALAAAKPAPKTGTQADLSDDDLFKAAQAGDMGAFEEWNKRKATQTFQELRGQENRQSLVQAQLDILQNKYPVLSNAQHPLTQTANAAYSLLVRRGEPATQATYLDAVKTAIADRPDLVTEQYTAGTRAREGARRVSAGNSGVTGATYRQDEPTSDEKVRVNQDQVRLAQRMNIKDPQKAIKNFLKRQEQGVSTFGAVAGFVPQGEF